MSEIEPAMDWEQILAEAEARLGQGDRGADPRRRRLQARIALGREAEPAAAMAAHLAEFPGDAAGWNLQAAYRLLAGEEAAALEAADRAVALAPEEAIFSYNRACARASTGDANGAIEDLERAIGCDEELRSFATADAAFEPLHDLPAFRALVLGADV